MLRLLNMVKSNMDFQRNGESKNIIYIFGQKIKISFLLVATFFVAQISLEQCKENTKKEKKT